MYLPMRVNQSLRWQGPLRKSRVASLLSASFTWHRYSTPIGGFIQGIYAVFQALLQVSEFLSQIGGFSLKGFGLRPT